MNNSCSGVILAGGLSSRFDGKNKAYLTIGQKRIIDRIYKVYSELFEEIVLVTNDPLRFLDMDLRIVTDIFSVRSSLTGIHAGLFHSTCQHAFFTACDTPFLKKEIVETIIEDITPGTDVVIPETSAGIEPLCAAYSKQCIKPIESNFAKGEYRIRKFFQKVRVKKIDEKTLRKHDHDLVSFFNVNTPDDLKKAKAIVNQKISINKGV